MAGRFISSRIITALVLFVVMCNFSTFGKNTPNKGLVERKAALQDLLKTIRGKDIKKPPRISKTKDGYLRFIAAPRLRYFSVDSGVLPKFAKPEDVADAFLQQHLNLFVNESFAVGFKKSRVNTSGPRTYVHYQQTYAGLDVFGAGMMIQVNGMEGIKAVMSDIMRETDALDSYQVSLQPAISSNQASQKAIEWMTSKYGEFVFEASEPALMIYCPSVVGSKGPIQLVWQTEVGNIGEPLAKELILVNAHSGDIALHFSLINELMHREIWDLKLKPEPPVLVLEDPPGGGDDPNYPTEINDIDRAYEYAKNTYDFYWQKHSRDSYDGNGATIEIRVRGGLPGGSAGTTSIAVGGGWATEDVIGHEFTHLVTYYSSKLGTQNETGAIHESFCDMWGEFIDQSYNDEYDNDAPEVKWLVAEDSPCGALRNMKNPPSFTTIKVVQGHVSNLHGIPQPDRYYSPFYYREGSPCFPDYDSNDSDDFDNEGIHHNCGVGNKLAYLLTDGDIFNGYSISGMGIDTTAALYYECQTNILNDSNYAVYPDYNDLANALLLAADNLYYELELTPDDLNNVENACRAVEIYETEDPASRLCIRDNSGKTVVFFDESGNLCFLGGTLTEQTTPQASENDEFRFKNSDGNDVMIVDTNSGDMCIAGSVYEEVNDVLEPNELRDNLVILDSNSDVVAYVDDLGDIYLKGGVYYQIVVKKVSVFTSDQYDDIGTDEQRGLTDCQIHFGEYDPLYVELEIAGSRDSVKEDFIAAIHSDSDTDIILLRFIETEPNSNICRIQNPLYVSEHSYSCNLFGALDEEHIYVDGVAGPKVDRGELASITIDGLTHLRQVAILGAGVFDKYLDKDDVNNPGYNYWWSNGKKRDVNYVDSDDFGYFIKDVGDVNDANIFPTIEYYSPADFLFECSRGHHGNVGEHLPDYELYKPGDGNIPTIDSNDWGRDVDWVILWSCNTLGQDGVWSHKKEGNPDSDPKAWTTYWDDALIRGQNENNCHGIFAFADYAGPYPRYVLEAFFEKLYDDINKKMVDAWMEAALSIDFEDPNFEFWCSGDPFCEDPKKYYKKQEWSAAALFHMDNINDNLYMITPDTNDPTMYYTWYDVEDSNYVYDPNDPCYPDPNSDTWEAGFGVGSYGSLMSTLLCLNLDDNQVKVACSIPKEQPQLYTLMARKELPWEKPYDFTGFDKVKFDNRGGAHFKKEYQKDGPIRLTQAEAQARAVDFIMYKGGGMPSDAKLSVTRRQMVQTYNASRPETTRNTYTKKAFFEYTHCYNGIDIVGGNLGDSILVTVAGDDVVGLRRHWRNIIGPVGNPQQVIPAADALDTVVEKIPKIIHIPEHKNYLITQIKLFYYGLPSDHDYQYLTPAWGFKVGRALWIYVNAFTGEFLN